MSNPTVIGTARRVHKNEAKAAFENGQSILVSEYGHEATQTVTTWTTTHTRETTTWAELDEQVRMWKGRYPNQRFYIVEFDEPNHYEVNVTFHVTTHGDTEAAYKTVDNLLDLLITPGLTPGLTPTPTTGVTEWSMQEDSVTDVTEDVRALNTDKAAL